ncbi:PAN domain containing protein [Aphelenchoides besseyi]|nr:PAN domain containing protein [Aphelenchoides besseyi]
MINLRPTITHQSLLLILWIFFQILLTVAIEDITNRKLLFGVATAQLSKEKGKEVLTPIDGFYPLQSSKAFESKKPGDLDAETEKRELRLKPLPLESDDRGIERRPYDNFGDTYRRINDSIFHQATTTDDILLSYPPLPTIALNEDSNAHTGAQTADVESNDYEGGYDLHRTTRETSSTNLYTQTSAEGRFQQYREQELLDDNRGRTTTPTPRRAPTNDIEEEDETNVPDPPPPDWAVRAMLAPGPGEETETQTEEPFLVTDGLKQAFSTPNGGQLPPESSQTRTTTTSSSVTPEGSAEEPEVPTMKLYMHEMQRGDINVRDSGSMVTNPSSFTPLSKRRPGPLDSTLTSNEVLMPQETPDDVDLPRVYEISPRLVLPIDDKTEASGNSDSAEENQIDLPQSSRLPPVAPPTLVSAERDRGEARPPSSEERIVFPNPKDEVSLFVAPRRGGNAALLVPISTPRTIPQTLAAWPNHEPLATLTPGDLASPPSERRTIAPAPPSNSGRPSGSFLLPSGVNVDYANEVETENEDERLFRTLATKPPGDNARGFGAIHPPAPSPVLNRKVSSERIAPPGFDQPNGPPGIGLSSLPPGFTPEQLISSTSRPFITTTTPYFTASLLPRGPTKNTKDEYSPRTLATTRPPSIDLSTPPIRTTVADYGVNAEGTFVDQRIKHGNFGRQPTTLVAFNPNVAVYASAAPVAVSNFGPSANLTNSFSFVSPQQPSLVKHPGPHVKHFGMLNILHHMTAILDAPKDRGFASQSIRENGGSKAAYFFVPPPVKLSMSKAVHLRPFHNRIPMVHTPRALLKNAVPTIPPPVFHLPTFEVSTTPVPSRLVKFRSENTNDVRISDGLKMHTDQLHWSPFGLTAPKRLGAVKLVPAEKDKEMDLQVEPFDDVDAQRDDQLCHVDLDDEFSDLNPDDRPNIRRCFKRARNCLLNSALPLERRVGYSEEQCVNFCGHHPFCRALVYSSVMRMCDIFDQRNGTLTARTVSYVGVSYYEPLNGRALDCWKSRLSQQFFTKTPPLSVLVDSNDRENTHQLSEDQRRSNGTSPVVIAPRDRCESDQDVVVLKSVGFRLRNFGVVPLLQNSSETECVFSCLVNLARGHIPYECASTTYGRLNGCLIYRAGTNTHGNGHLIAEPGFTHYEKSCVSQSLVDLCRGYPIIRQPQHTLLGYSKQALRANSLIECLELCFTDYIATRECRSIMYFYEERTDNCVLNTQSRQTAPQFFVNETDELVDYASFETCLDSQLELPRRSNPNTLQRNELETPPRVANRPFMPRAIAPPVGTAFKETTKVYTSTHVTRPPPQYIGTNFRTTISPELSNAITTSEKKVYVVDEKGVKNGLKRSGTRRRSSKVPVRKFIINSEGKPTLQDDNNNVVLTKAEAFHRRLSQILSESIRPLKT